MKSASVMIFVTSIAGTVSPVTPTPASSASKTVIRCSSKKCQTRRSSGLRFSIVPLTYIVSSALSRKTTLPDAANKMRHSSPAADYLAWTIGESNALETRQPDLPRAFSASLRLPRNPCTATRIGMALYDDRRCTIINIINRSII